MDNFNPGSSKESRQALLAKAERQSKKDRRKLITMAVGLALVIGAWFYSSMQGQQDGAMKTGIVGQEPAFNETVLVETFDMSSIADKILDKRPEDRVLLPSSISEPVTNYVFGKNHAQFHAMGVVDMTAELRAEIENAPADHRGKPYRVRGKLEDIKQRKRLDGKVEYRGWLRAADGTTTHFISMGVPKEIILNGPLRFEGLFVKLYRTEGHAGEPITGPLLIGAKLVNSYAPLTEEDLTPEKLIAGLSRIEDDTARNSRGLNGPVFDVQWQLMEYAKTDAYKAINWETDAVELNNDTLAAILSNGSAWRFRRAGDDDPRVEPGSDGSTTKLSQDLVPIPIRLPVSRNMGINTVDAGENPANLDKLTEGWIGNMGWTKQASVVYFVHPGARPDLLDRIAAPLLEARGFFVKNHNYESKGKGTRTAAFFVFTEMTQFAPVKDMTAENLMMGVMVVALILFILFPILLVRDRRKSEALQRDLVRRKQERRRRTAGTEQPQT